MDGTIGRMLLEELESETDSRSEVFPIPEEGSEDTLIRSYMNVRLPVPAGERLLDLQDRYLASKMRERGIVEADSIPPVSQSLQSHAPFSDRICIWQGDITRLRCDAIVNAANSGMLGCFQPCHACIDNCIHTYAGIQLRLECARRMEALMAEHGNGYVQPTAVPMLTDAYNLPCRKVVHVVGPIVYGPLDQGCEDDLAACYRNVLDTCAENGLRTVAFCCISTGVFRFPNRRAAEIAIETVRSWLEKNDGKIDKVIFNVFLDKDRCIYEELLRRDARRVP